MQPKKTRHEKKEQSMGKKWLKSNLLPFRMQIIWLTVLAVSATALAVSFSYLVQFLVNGAESGNRSQLILFSIILVALLIARIALQTLKSYLTERANARMTARLRGSVFSHTLRAEYASLEKYHSGDLLNRMTSDVAEVAGDSVTLLPATVGMIVQAVGAFAALLALDPLFTVIYVGSCALGGLLAALCRKRLKRIQKEISAADGESRSFIQESQSSVMTVKAYSAEARTEKKSATLLEKYYRKRMERNRLRTGVNGVFSLLGGLGMIFALVWCGLSILRGEGDYGSLFSVMLLLGQLQRPVGAISAVLPMYYAREAAAERLAEIEALPTERVNEADETDVDVVAIGAEGVSFSYDAESKPLLSDVNLEFAIGSRVCITGESGSGKSSFFKLLLSVYAPTEGNFYKRTQSGEKHSFTAEDRRLFAYVPQGNFLFSGTIRENLCFFSGDDAPKDERLYAALETACADFVYDLPMRLDTPLHERGGGLSEGQVQRLAVARALLSERKILLLDEATSALDGETEKKLLENLAKANRTCIIVTHRPAALEGADVILHVQDGRVQLVRGK